MTTRCEGSTGRNPDARSAHSSLRKMPAAFGIVRVALGVLLLVFGVVLVFGPNMVSEIEQRSMEERVKLIEEAAENTVEKESKTYENATVISEKESLRLYNEEARLGLRGCSYSFVN